jgi:hypothetical protein
MGCAVGAASERHLEFAGESDTKVVGGGEPSLQNVADGLVELDGSTDSQDERFGRGELNVERSLLGELEGELLEGEQSRRARAETRAWNITMYICSH